MRLEELNSRLRDANDILSRGLLGNLEEERLSTDNLKKPWTINGSQWLTIKKIHEPWIAEISPVQYARMGKSQKASYDRKRRDEWDAAAAGKKEWRDAVYRAHKAGEFDISDKDVHPDAKQAVSHSRQREDEEEKKGRMAKATEKNRIQDTSELKVGDRVYSIMSRGYVEVLKISKKSVRISSHAKGGMKQSPFALQWLSHDDLKKSVLGE